MYSSLNIWPTSTNPATFIPVIVQYFPFENYDSTIIYNEPPECCPYCKRYIDKHIIQEGENKYKCAWCSKTFKSSNIKSIESQISQSSQPNKSRASDFLSTPLKYNFPQSMEHNFVKSSLSSVMIYRQLLGSHNFDHRSNIFISSKSDPNLNVSPSFCYTLFFVIDTCVDPQKFDTLKEYLLIAIEALKPTQPFILVVIHRNYISYVFSFENEQDKVEENKNVFVFNFSYRNEDQKVFRLIDLRKPANFVSNFDALKKFINSLKSDIEIIDDSNDFSAISRKSHKKIKDKEGKNPVDYFIQQILGDDTFYSEIVLFSTNGPTIEINKQIFIDFISPDSNIKTRPLIDGYFICSDIPNPKEQIRYMIKNIGENPVIFNVEINAYVTNYRFVQNTDTNSHFANFTPFSKVSSISTSNAQLLPATSSNSSISLVSQINTLYSTANENFSVSFQLFSSTRFTNAFNLFSPSYFGIEMSYIKFFHNNVFKETIWTSRIFNKSPDFIPTITTINPFVLIPYLCIESAFNVQEKQNKKMNKMKRRSQTHSGVSFQNQNLGREHSLVESFVLNLMKNYRYLCIVSIPGKFDDFTFSIIPELQWFLRILFEHLLDYNDIKHTCNIKNLSNTVHTEYFSNDVIEDDDGVDYFDSIDMNIFENHKKFLFNSIFPISCNIMENFSRYYPSISFWNDEDNVMIVNCPFDLSFYESVGSPPIVLIDTLLVLFIFSDDYENLCSKLNKSLDNSHDIKDRQFGSGINLFISKLIDKRFPKTIILGQPLSKFYKLLPEKNKLFASIKYYMNNNLLRKND